MFQPIYNQNDTIVRTPSSSSLASTRADEDYHAITDTCSTPQFRSAFSEFQQMLREQGFDGRVQSSPSYSTASLKYQRDYRTHTRKIFLHLAKLMAPNDYEELCRGIVQDESIVNHAGDNR